MATKVTPQLPASQSSGWHALLATIEYIVDSPGRTERARKLLYPLLVATFLIAMSATMVMVFAAPSWIIGAIGLATATTGAVGRRRAR